MGSADAVEVPLMDLKVPAGTVDLSLKMKSEYGCQFSNVDPKLCELIYEANRHFRTMRRKHEYEHTPLGWQQFEELLTDDVYNDAPYVKKIGRRANSSERPPPRNRRFSRRSSSAERAFSAEPRMLNGGSTNYEDYLNKNEEPRLTAKYATVQNKPRNSINRPNKVRIRLPPFVAYGGGCSGGDFGDMKTYNVNAANNVSKNALQAAHVNGILKANRSRNLDSEEGAALAKSVYRPTASWLPRDVIPDWKTEYRSNYCS